MSKYWVKATDGLNKLVEVFVEHTPNMILAVLVFLLTYFGSSRLHRFTFRILTKHKIALSARYVIANAVSVSIILGGVFLILSIMKLDDFLKALLGAAGIAGLAVSLALQGTLSNIFSGIVLSFVKSVKIGDWVDTNGYSGEIVDINMRVTTLSLSDGNRVTIPNKMVIEGTLKNYSLTKDSNVIVNCKVDYQSDLEYVEKLVVKSIKKELPNYIPGTRVVFFYTDFQENAITFELRFRTRSTKAIEIAIAKGNAIKLIHRKFKENNIKIPLPIRIIQNELNTQASLLSGIREKNDISKENKI